MNLDRATPAMRLGRAGRLAEGDLCERRSLAPRRILPCTPEAQGRLQQACPARMFSKFAHARWCDAQVIGDLPLCFSCLEALGDDFQPQERALLVQQSGCRNRMTANRLDRSLNMRPASAMHDFCDGRLRDAKGQGQSVQGFTEDAAFANLSDLIGFEFGTPAPADYCVLPVVLGGAYVKMIWPDADRVVAVMQDPQPLRDRPECQPPHCAMSKRLGFPAEGPHAVTVPSHIYSARPAPAAITYCDALKETLQLWPVPSHVPTPFPHLTVTHYPLQWCAWVPRVRVLGNIHGRF